VDRLERLSTLARERRALVAVARAEGLDAEEALECVQDALITFLGLPENDHPLATVKTIVRNAARNHRRLHRRALPHQPFDDESSASGDVDAENLLAHAEDVVRLRLCVSSLCGVQRAVITLRLLEERSGEDVADALGLTRSHVDVLVHRAKAALRVCMTHQS
jgi:RNA polymerase sigma-70 factor, ECF subfamily